MRRRCRDGALCAKHTGAGFAKKHDVFVETLQAVCASAKAKELVANGALDLSWWLSNRKVAAGVCSNAFRLRLSREMSEDDDAGKVALEVADLAAEDEHHAARTYGLGIRQVGEALADPHSVRATASNMSQPATTIHDQRLPLMHVVVWQESAEPFIKLLNIIAICERKGRLAASSTGHAPSKAVGPPPDHPHPYSRSTMHTPSPTLTYHLHPNPHPSYLYHVCPGRIAAGGNQEG